MLQSMGTKEGGFSLVELMVVVLIIAILIAIAIPTFLGARRSAQDEAAKVELRNVINVERNYYVDNEDYTDVAAALVALEPRLVLDPDPALGVAVVLSADTDIVCMTRTSESGRLFSVWESVRDGTYFGVGPGADLSGACPVAVPAGFSPQVW